MVDIIRNPPAADPDGVLRSHLLQTHSLTDYARCKSIMSCHCCPKEHQKCLFLRYAFLGQLPSDVRSHLVHDKTADIAILSQRTDKICWSSLSSSLSVNAVDSVHAVNTPPSRQNRRVQHSDRASSPITHCSQTPAAPSRRSSSPSFCWYHAKFGAKALSCQAPCTWSEN